MSNSYCLSEKRKWLSNLSIAHDTLSCLSRYIGKRHSDLDYEIRSRSMREGFEKLPDEIISAIFVSASRSFESYHDRSHSSLRISQISRRLRRIALHTPELWSIISTSFPPSMIPAFVKRSGTKGLDVQVANIKSTKRLTNFWQQSFRQGSGGQLSIAGYIMALISLDVSHRAHKHLSHDFKNYESKI